jgi:SAM-dependent methyltransferase
VPRRAAYSLEEVAMPDIYANITEVDAATVTIAAAAMELSAAEPQHRAMVEAYLADLSLPERARVLEIGCGTGAIGRMLAGHPAVSEVVGVDPSPQLIARARELAAGDPKLAFHVGDGRDLGLPEATFDAVVVHRVLSHVDQPRTLFAQAFGALRAGGRLAAFDGDYATITLATGDADPLQTCVSAFAPSYITDPWIVRRLVSLALAAGFEHARLRSFGFVQIEQPDYMLSIADRGADAMVAAGRIGAPLAAALKAEARRRVAEHAFFGHIAYACLVARKPLSRAP